MQFTTARIAAVVAVTGVVLFGATTATAGGSPTIPDGSVWQSDIAKPVNDLYLRDMGKGSVVRTVGKQTIAHIGGSFVANRTRLGGFNLPAGTWLITTAATFTRTFPATNAATKTRPQVALRYGLVEHETSAGTIAGMDISPTVGHTLSGSTVQTVTTSAPATTVWIWGFGENDDNSDCFCAEITVAAQITATRIG